MIQYIYHRFIRSNCYSIQIVNEYFMTLKTRSAFKSSFWQRMVYDGSPGRIFRRAELLRQALPKRVMRRNYPRISSLMQRVQRVKSRGAEAHQVASK
jgi:hypothetical protein